MRFGLFGGALAAGGASSDSQNYGKFIDYVCEADALGFESIYVVEHHFTGLGQVSATLNLLSYLAARTNRIRLGTGVTVLPWHNPVLLAEQIGTLDILSGGRADIGIGKGYRPIEFNGFNIDQSQAAERYEEALALILKSLTATERFSHSGKYWTFNDIVVEPAPLQKPHPPIWVGAGSTPSIEKAASRGFKLLLDLWADTPTIGERVQIFRNACERAGRVWNASDVGTARSINITHSEEASTEIIRTRANLVHKTGALKGSTFVAPAGLDPDSMEAAWAFAERAAIIGTPDMVVSRLKELEALGVEYVLLTDTTASTDALREFAREIMPAFSDKSRAGSMSRAS